MVVMNRRSQAVEETNQPNIQIAIRTLLTGGFTLENARREPGYMIFNAYRYDEFGTRQRYCFALADGYMGEAQVEGAQISAHEANAQLIIIGSAISDTSQIEWLRFINLFGGPVFSSLPIEASFADHLVSLGHNHLPDGLEGAPDDLFEIYVQLALEFIFAGRVIRYGQERRFETRPDGLAIPNPEFTALYDAKAYANGYEVTIDTIRQFSSYVLDFQRRYLTHRQRLNTFIVVSGNFPHRPKILDRRSRDLIAQCGVPISFLTAENLASIIAIVSKHPSLRRSINWGRIFSEPIIDPDEIQSEIVALLRDRVITKGSE